MTTNVIPQQSARSASPVEQPGRLVRESQSSPIVNSELVSGSSVISSSSVASNSPSVVRSSVARPDQRPSRRAKTNALIKMKEMM